MKPFAYARPKSLAEVHALLSPTARPKGAGMDLLDLAKNRVSTPDTLVNLAGVPDLDALDVQAGGMANIGCRVTLATLASDPDVAQWLPALADAAGSAATPQVRSVATVAGNLLQRPRCPYFRDPFFDCLKRGGKTCPSKEGEHAEGAIFGNSLCCAVHPSNLAVALLALGGEMTISTGYDAKEGNRTRSAALDPSFFVEPKEDPLREARLEPGELIWMASVKTCKHSAYVEVDQKQSFDWASASAAVALEMEGDRVKSARIALGHVAPVPLLAEEAAAHLAGKGSGDFLRTHAAAREAAKLAVKGATPLRDNAHKARHLEICVGRAIKLALERGR